MIFHFKKEIMTTLKKSSESIPKKVILQNLKKQEDQKLIQKLKHNYDNPSEEHRQNNAKERGFWDHWPVM